MIKAIIFDCFGVLYKDAGLLFYEKNVKNYDELREQIQEIDNHYDLGLIDVLEHDKAVAEISGLEADFIAQNVRREHHLNEDLMEYIGSLRMVYKIGVLSNIGKGGMESFFTVEQQKVCFDEVVLSSDVGIIKPNPEIFKIIAERLCVEPDECVMIDDRDSNCRGAEVAGMKAVLYTTNRNLKLDLKKSLNA